MFKEFFILLLLAHLLGDFYMQTKSLAEKKQNRIRWVFLHAILYWMANLLVSLPFRSCSVIVFSSISAFSHLIIDVLKYAFFTNKKKLSATDNRKIFFFDQFIHLFLIALIAFLFADQGKTLLPISVMIQIGNVTGLQPLTFLTWITIILALHKPSNLCISHALTPYKPGEEKSTETLFTQGDRNAGRFIGTLERAIIIMLLSLQQYSAIGLVLTAKSVARYDKIAKDSIFAEYYLLGTLLSTLLAIIISRIA